MKKKKILSILLVLSMIFSMFPFSVFASDPVVTDTATKDVFLNVDSDAGYSATELTTAVRNALQSLDPTAAQTVRIKNNSTEIDTTDLSGWYVYDHYDTNYWTSRATTLSNAGKIASNNLTLAWQYDMGMASLTDYRRPYTGQTYSEMYGEITKLSDYIAAGHPLGNVQKYDQHIYSGIESSGSFMTFVGYGSPAYTDYLFYPDNLSGTKTVSYTIDSSDVKTHSLSSAGFLVNTGIDASGNIKGYILVYAYSSSTSYSLGLYPIKSGVTAQQFTDGNSLLSYCDAAKVPTTSGSLTTLASTDVKLTISPTSVKVEHKTPAATDYTTMKEWTGLTETAYNGFGPYVKYSGHGCWETSSYKFTNLKMSSSTDAGTSVSAFASLQNAEYLEDVIIDKYFVNILGSKSSFNLNKDASYLELVQDQDINLFTNKDVTTISGYLPAYYEDTTNTTLSALATSIAKYILGETEGIKVSEPAAPPVAEIVANFTLFDGDSLGEVQVSSIKRELIGAAGVNVDVHNKSVAPSEIELSALTPVYTLTKPDGTELTITMPLKITNNSTNWPVGQYKVTMDYEEDSIPGYASFTILEDKAAPTVEAVQNGNMVDLTFTNTASSGEYGFTSDLAYYMVISNDSATQPSQTGLPQVAISDGATFASVPLEEGQYFHVFLQDEAGNVGYDSFKLTYLPLTTTAPTASDITYGPLSQSILTGGTATYGSNAISGKFVWNAPATIPNVGMGDYPVHFAPDNALYVANDHNVSVKVSPATPSITLSDKSVSYTGNPISIDAAIVSGVAGGSVPSGAISYTYYTDISCTTLTTPGNSSASANGGAPVYAGKYYAKATIAALGNYTSATTAAPGTLTISSTSDAGLSIGSDQTKTYGDESFVISPTGGNGTGSVTFISSNPATASITTDGYVTIKAVGNTVITATKAADGNYDAQSTSITLTVKAKPVTYTIASNEKTYTGTAQYAAVIPSVSTLVVGKDYTVTYMKDDTVVSEPTAKGIYTIEVSTINGNYSGSATGTLTIGSTVQSELKITGVPANDIQYGDTFTLSANGGSGTGNVTFSSGDGEVATVDSTTGAVTITGVGTVTITATKEADANFNVQTATITFTSAPKAVYVTATATDRDYVVGNKDIEVSLSTDVDGVTAGYVSATVRSANAGTEKEVTITGVTLSDPNYKPVSTIIYTTVTINSIDDTVLTIKGEPSSITYGDADFKLTAASKGTGEVTWSSDDNSVAEVNSKTGVVTITGVGDATITADKESDGNYHGTSIDIPITVEPKEVTYTITNNTKPYTGGVQYATVKPSIYSLKEGVDYTVTYSEENPTDAGEYDITVETTNPNYVGESTGAILTIQAVDQTYTLEIGGLPSYIEYEDTFALYANGGNGTGEISWSSDDESVAEVNSRGKVEIIGVGEATITATKSGDRNYEDQSQSITFTTNQKEISVAISGTAKTYNGRVQEVTIKGTATKTPLNEIVKVIYVNQADDTETSFRNAGTYNVNVEVDDSYSQNYVLSGYTTAVATIAKADLVITAVDKSKTYGDKNPDFELSYTLLGSDRDKDFNLPTITCTADETSDVGNYAIELFYDGDHGNDNYDITLQNGILTVNPRMVTIKWQDITSFVYDSTIHAVIAELGNKVNNDMIDFTYTGSNATDVDGYMSEITGISGEKSNNYSLPTSGLTKNWSITKAPLNVKADDKSIKYKDAVPEYTVTYDAFVGTEDASVLGGELNLSCDYVQDGDIGSFNIVPSGLSSGNYDITFTNGTLKVVKLPVTVSANGSTSNISVNLSPAVSGLTLDKFIVKQGENTIAPTSLTEGSSGARYTLAAGLIDETKYTITVDNGTNYEFASATFTAAAPSNGGSHGSSRRDKTVVDTKPIPVEPVVVKNPFNDVNEKDWFYNAVQYVNNAGLMSGTSTSTFEPNMETSRSMIVTILYRLEGKPEITKASDFKDVASGTWYTDAVAWASKNGVVTGYNAENFGPENNITLEQMIAILYRYAKYKGYDVSKTAELSFYTDADKVSPWALTSMKWAVAEGLLSGTTNTTLLPTSEAKRAQVADILMRFMQDIVKK